MPAYEQIKLELGGLLPLGEKMKLLNKFISKAKESEVDNILKDCDSLPGTQFNLLKLLLADKFHRSDLIIDLLREGDTATLNGAVAKRWLYEGEDNKLVDSEFLLNELFPNVSYNCRQKVLYRIGRFVQNEEKADRIWNAVEHRYGFNVAFPILPACSKVKISSMIGNGRVKLYGYQLVQILEKYPDVGMEYFKKHYSKVDESSSNSYRSPLYYIYENHPDDFLDLCINYPDKVESFPFGRGRSTKMIRTYRQKLLENPTKFSSILKLDRIRRLFSNEEFQMFFESSLATETLANFNCNNDMWKWVRAVPINKRVEMVNQTFTKLFQINLDEHQNYMCPEYIVLLPDEKRLSAVQWKVENDNNYGWSWSFKNIYVCCYDDEEKKRAWMPLKPSSHSVPELQKQLLNEQDVNKRATLSKYLIETCYVNDDLPRLLDVLILLSKRSRNDQSEVRSEIFRTIGNIMLKMEFSKEHWDVIIEMIQVSLVFKDNRDYSEGEKEKILAKCLSFYISSKLPLNALVIMHIKLKIQTGNSSWTNPHIKNPTDKRILLESYVKELENLQLANNLQSYSGVSLGSEKSAEFIANLIEEICKFNKGLTGQSNSSKGVYLISISSHPWLRNSLEQIAKEEEDRINKTCSARNSQYSWNFAKQLVNIIQALKMEQNLSLNAFSSSEDLFIKILRCSPSNSILFHFLRRNPSELVKEWSTTLSKTFKGESTQDFIRSLKSWNYADLVTESMNVCYDIIKQVVEKDSGVTIQQKCNAVLALSVLSEPPDFLTLTAEYYPPEKKVDVFAENSDEDYQIRQTFAKSLRNVTTPHLTFPAIEKFCVGDYLKLIVGCFYSQTGRAQEAISMDFLRQKVVNSPVSLQKHVIRQFFTISSVEDRCRILNEIDSSNVSIRYEIFMQAIKLLRTSPSKETWDILKTIMDKTSTDDAPIILFLHSTPKLDTCPPEYLSDYIINVLVILRKLKADKVEDFMNHLVKVMAEIAEHTLDDIILYKDADQVSFSSTFCVTYLQSSSSHSVLEHRLSNMKCLLQNAIQNGWDLRTPRRYDENNFDYPTRTLIFSFISSLCLAKIETSKIWQKNQIFETLLASFKAESATKFFKEIMYLELSLIVVKDVEKNGTERLRSFGRNMAQFVDSLVEIYGGEIICIVKDIVDDYVRNCFSDELSKNVGVIVELIDGILETSRSRSNQIICMSFLQSANPKANNLIATLEKVNAVLKESQDIVAQIYLVTKTH